MCQRLLLVTAAAVLVAGRPCGANWYDESFFLLHEDHHTVDRFEVGRDASFDATSRLVGLSRPDVIQIHAKGNPGWTTYPSTIGHVPPKLARDVLAIWRDVARRDGYHFSVYYNIGRDGVIMERRPEWNRSQADGKPWDRALCYHSGVAREYLWPMVGEIIERYRPDGFWFDGSCFTVRACYCPKCRERFRREQNRDAPERPGAPGWGAYQEMQRQIYREFVAETAATIHAIDPECLVAVNWAWSLRMPEKPGPGIAYLTGDIGNRVEGLSPEAHWYDSQRLPFDLMTQLSTLYEVPDPPGGAPARQMRPKPRAQIEQEMAVIVANGGRYFVWDNPTPESGLVAERLEFLAEVVAPFLRARQPWCLGSKRLPDVSLLHDAAAHYAVTHDAITSFTRNNNRIDGATETLARLHLNYEMLPDWRLAERDVQSPLVIVEHPKRLTEATVDGLARFVADGGSLLMTGMGVGQDDRLGKLLGIARFEGPSGPEPLTFAGSAAAEAFDHWLFRLELSTARAVLEVRDAEGTAQPILTENRSGRGRAFYVPIPLLTRHGKNVVPDALLRAVFDHVVPPRRRRLTTDAPATVEVVLRELPGRQIVHLVNMAPGRRRIIATDSRRYPLIRDIPPVPPCRISLRLATRPSAVELQPRGVALDGWKYEQGRLEADVPGFEIHQMVVIRIGE